MKWLSPHTFTDHLFLCWCISHSYLTAYVQSDPSLPVPSVEVDVDLFLDSYSAYNHYTSNKKEITVTSLAYITPWNNVGYDMAITFGRKFDLVSPVWFQLTNHKKAYTVTGIQDVDTAWMDKVRVANPEGKIVPRFIFQDWHGDDFHKLFANPPDKQKLMFNMLRVLQNYKFNGAVVEIWSQFVGPSEQQLIDFIKDLSSELRKAGLLFILVIPPPFYRHNIPGRFNRNHFELLYKDVDYFSIMTYDYSPPSQPGPNSPIDWAEQCIMDLVPQSSKDMAKKRSQLLMGLNFYGMHHVPQRRFGDAILGHQFVEVIKSERPNFVWDAKTAEHHVSFIDAENQEHVIYYPTLMSLAQRLSLADKLRTGVSIWEIGQGLESFFTLM